MALVEILYEVDIFLLVGLVQELVTAMNHQIVPRIYRTEFRQFRDHHALVLEITDGAAAMVL
jgi:hypothetical protein